MSGGLKVKKAAKQIVATVVAFMSVIGFTGCDSRKTPENSSIKYTETLKVCNLIEYIDRTTITDCEKDFAIKVEFAEFDSNEDMYNYVSKNPNAYDVLMLSDYTIDRFIKEGKTGKLNKGKVPNIAHIAEEYLHPAYDPDNDYVIPYMAGTIGILYNKKRVTLPIDSWTVLFDKQYGGKVFMMDSMRNSIGVALQTLGFSMNSSDDSELAQAKSLLLAARSTSLFHNEIIIRDKMVAGEGVLSVIYSGEAKIAIDRNPDLAYVIPKEGAYKWLDGFVVMKNTSHAEAAQNFINFMCRPNIAVRNMTKIGYTSPIKGAWSEFGSNRIMFPTAEDLEHCEELLYDAQAALKYNRLWAEIR
jgi:spermidine/putrescine transport system substrate-binding protein